VVKAVVGEEGSIAKAQLMRQGDLFAHREMLTKSTHEKTIRARGHVELLALSNADLIEVLHQFPDVYLSVHQYAVKKYNYSV